MRPEDIRIGTKFSMRDISSYYGEVLAIDEDAKGKYAIVQYFTCFSGGRERVPLTYLANEKIFRLELPKPHA